MIHFIYPRPNCKTCGEPMQSWNPWIKPEDQEHVECASERIINNVFESLKTNLEEE